MDPVGQGFRFDFAVRYVCEISGNMQTGEKKLWEFLSILCLYLDKPVGEFLVTKGMLGTNSHFLIFVKFGKYLWRLCQINA